MSRIAQYLSTIRFLKPRQVIHQIRHRLASRKLVDRCSASLTFRVIPLLPFLKRPVSWTGRGQFHFLNQPGDLGQPLDWNAVSFPKLWQYNLHYFDFLQQPQITFSDGLMLIESWIQRHPPKRGAVGWEPYPVSHRVVNWLKFFSRHKNPPPESVVESLSLQAANLERQIEYHILGNHLFANGTALWFLGEYLQSRTWKTRGEEIIFSELPEQFLADGGHFELSPMYHSLMLEYLLDLINLAQSSAQITAGAPALLRATAAKALGWLNGIIDEQQRIPLLNDSAFGVAPVPEDLNCYARQLQVQPNDSNIPSRQIGEWKMQNLSGYRVLRKGAFHLVFDTALLGPDHLPAHAHGDLLSVLLNFNGKPVFTDTGVYEYSEGPTRQYSRSTLAHNTVVVDGRNQAEFWKSFRLGARGHPRNLCVEANRISCAHDGFINQGLRVLHTRIITLLPGGFEISDRLEGKGHHDFTASFHCGPEIKIKAAGADCYMLDLGLKVTCWGAENALTESDYFPEYDRRLRRSCLLLKGRFESTIDFGIKCASFS